ncbi:hypothetical protein B0H13DRAFT_2368532 [Mycena leptocephala]|nr:hypothetical protein B0H13DRAFT_2368532 [Mycena leptocephala]
MRNVSWSSHSPHSQNLMNASSVVPKVVLLASSWLNVSLYTLELVLCRRYFLRPNRPLLYRVGVGALIFFDTICTLAICIDACLVALDLTPNAHSVALQSPMAITVFSTFLSAAVEQAILCHLFFTLTRNAFVSAFLAILALAHMGLAFASGGLILALSSELTAALTTGKAAAMTCAATDIFIATALGSKVWKMLSPTDVIPAAESFTRRFLLLVVSSGLIVASNTLIFMVLLWTHNAAGNLFLTCQGRVYSLTLLANFLVGIHFRRDDDTTDVSTQSRRGPNPSVLTGVVFDVVHGYDTESASHNTSRVGAVDSKAPSARLSYISNLGVESTRSQLGYRASPRMNSEP